MKTENSGKSRMRKDAPGALCEFAGVDPARKWAQCERERDEWAALAGQYKSERDEALEKYFVMRDLSNNAAELAEKYQRERDELQEEVACLRESLRCLLNPQCVAEEGAK